MSASNYITLLVAAKHALLSYANGNASVALGVDLAEKIDAALNGMPKKWGIPIAQEPKYTTCPVTGFLSASGIAIPGDEPTMTFRAQDIHARKVISYYVNLVTQDDPRGNHKDVCFDRYQQFIAFAEQHPGRMKSPDTAPAVTA